MARFTPARQHQPRRSQIVSILFQQLFCQTQIAQEAFERRMILVHELAHFARARKIGSPEIAVNVMLPFVGVGQALQDALPERHLRLTHALGPHHTTPLRYHGVVTQLTPRRYIRQWSRQSPGR